MTYFSNSQELLAQFGDFASHELFDPIPLRDTRVGFSVKKNYPNDIRYKPAVGQNSGQPDNVATIWIVYAHPEDSPRRATSDAVPLRIRIATMSKYRSKHWDYDPEDKEGDSPSRDSIEASAATPAPIELEYPGDFVFDHAQSSFFDRKGNRISGAEILDRVFQDHCNTVHRLRGLRLRTKLFTQAKLTGLLAVSSSLLVWTLKSFFGRSIEDNDMMAGAFRTYKLEALKKYDADSLDILGYKASKQVVILFCFLAILVSYHRFRSGASDDYISSIGGSEFLSIVHGVFLIWILDVVVPLAIFFLINGLIWLRTTVMFMKFKWP
jgi:hypothetical protein